MFRSGGITTVPKEESTNSIYTFTGPTKNAYGTDIYQCVETSPDGEILSKGYGPLLDGKKHGVWRESTPSGKYSKSDYENGVIKAMYLGTPE